MVGRNARPEGSRMMRKTSLFLLGAAAGVAVTLVTTQPRLLLEGARAQAAAAADTYRQLSLFGDVFERVRADYVEKPDDGKLIESAIYGMLARLDPHVRTRQQPQDGKDLMHTKGDPEGVVPPERQVENWATQIATSFRRAMESLSKLLPRVH